MHQKVQNLVKFHWQTPQYSCFFTFLLSEKLDFRLLAKSSHARPSQRSTWLRIQSTHQQNHCTRLPFLTQEAQFTCMAPLFLAYPLLSTSLSQLWPNWRRNKSHCEIHWLHKQASSHPIIQLLHATWPLYSNPPTSQSDSKTINTGWSTCIEPFNPVSLPC